MSRLPRIACLLAVSLLAGLVPSTRAESPWPGFRGADGTGRSLAALPPGDGALGLEVRWTREIGSGYSGIAVTADAVVTAVFGGEVDEVVVFDRESGDERWRAPLGPAYPGHDGSHDGPIATPVVAGDRVVMLGPRGDLRAFALDDGEVLWRRHLVDELESEKPFYGFGGSPVVVGDRVVLQIGGADGSVAAFALADGALRWRALEDEIGAQTPVLTTIGGRDRLVVLGNRRVAALDPDDGTVLWSFEHHGGRGATAAYTSSPLVVGGERVFLKHSLEQSGVFAVGGEEPSAEPAATTKGMARSYSPPTVWDGVVYGYTARFLSAADAATGELLWRSREPGDGFLAAVGGHLAILTKEGTLHLGPASREGFSETASVELFDDLAWTPPSVAGSSLFVRSLGGLARVDLVRTDGPASGGEDAPIPNLLRALVADLEDAEDRGAVATAFLDGLDEHPLVDGEEVVFFWNGDAEDVAIAGDMIGMRREEPMHRIEGTDMWWYATRLDRHARISYAYIVDDEPRLDPRQRREFPSTLLGPDMNWQRADRLSMSWFAMPEWPGAVALESFSAEVEVPGREEGETESRTVRARVWLPPGYADDAMTRYPVLFVHDDGGEAVEVGEWPATLDRVVGRSVAPLIVVFVAPPWIRDWPGVFLDQFVPAVEARYRTSAERLERGNYAVGWGAGTVLMTAFRGHATFGVVGVQSLFALESETAAIREALGELTAESAPLRAYVEWGRRDLISPHEEMNFREAGRAGWQLLRERGWEPMGGEVWDSTDWASWRNRTAVMLESLFPLEGSGPSPGLAAWTTDPDD